LHNSGYVPVGNHSLQRQHVTPFFADTVHFRFPKLLQIATRSFTYPFASSGFVSTSRTLSRGASNRLAAHCTSTGPCRKRSLSNSCSFLQLSVNLCSFASSVSSSTIHWLTRRSVVRVSHNSSFEAHPDARTMACARTDTCARTKQFRKHYTLLRIHIQIDLKLRTDVTLHSTHPPQRM
jgi:hypothetical protein